MQQKYKKDEIIHIVYKKDLINNNEKQTKNSNNIVKFDNNTKIDIMNLSKCIIMSNQKIEINLDNIINKIFEKIYLKK